MKLTKHQVWDIRLILTKNKVPETIDFLNRILNKRQYNENDQIRLNEIKNWYNYFWVNKRGSVYMTLDAHADMLNDGYGYNEKTDKYYKL